MEGPLWRLRALERFWDLKWRRNRRVSRRPSAAIRRPLQGALAGVLVGITGSGWAATYQLPDGPFPGGCTVSGSVVTCSSVSLGNNDAVVVDGTVSWSMNDLAAGQNVEINAAGSAGDLDIQVDNNFNAGNNLILNAEVTAPNVSIGNNAEIVGDFTASSNLNIGNGADFSGDIDGGNINLGNNSTYTGNVTASGALNIGNNTTVLGNCTPDDPACIASAPELLVEYRMEASEWTGAVDEVEDASGNLRAATAVDDADTTDQDPAIAGSPGTCRSGVFDGSGDYIEDPNASAYLDGLRAITVMAWIKNTDTVGNDRGVFTTASPGSQDNRLGLRYDDDGASTGNRELIKASINTDACADGSDCLQVETEGGLQVQNQWQHVAMTWESGERIRIFVDGSEVPSTVTNSGIGVHDGTLDGIDFLRVGQGKKSGSPSAEWQGGIDEFRIYDQALSQGDITRAMNETHPCPSGLPEVRAGRITLRDTFQDPSFTPVCFDTPFESRPLVFALPTAEGPDPQALRIRNVTASGFEISQVEPDGEDGPHVEQVVDFVAIEPGEYTLEDGTRLIADSIATTEVQEGGLFSFGTGWETVNFTTPFDDSPAILAMVQTVNNESGSPPAQSSVPWLVTAVEDVRSDRFDLALERAESTAGSVDQPETVGYLAIEAGRSGALTDELDFESIRSGDRIRGWGNGCYGVGFSGNYSDIPLVVATQNTRDGGNGGWLRRCSLDSNGVGLTVDEDRDGDGERSHTTERAGILVLSGGYGNHACDTATLDHLRLEHDGQGLTCRGEAVTVSACADADCNQLFSGPVEVDLSSTPAAGWDPDPVTITGGSTVVELRHLAPEAVRIDATATSPAAAAATECLRSDGTATCELVFAEVGVVIDGDAGDGVPESPLPVQIAGKPSDTGFNAAPQRLRVVRTDDQTGACIAGVANEQLEVDFHYAVPVGGEGLADNRLQVEGETAGTLSAAGSSVPVTLAFDANGVAPFRLTARDAGRHSLTAAVDIPVTDRDGGRTGETVAASDTSNAFVVRPLAVHGDADGNPAAQDASGGVFAVAGEDFSLRFRPVGWTSGADADADGQWDRCGRTDLGDPAATVRVPGWNLGRPGADLLAPSGGSGGSLVYPADAAFGHASATSTATAAFDEVGIVQLQPGALPGFLGEPVALCSPAIGRFTPARFEVNANTPAFAPFCGPFTYLGQPFEFDVGLAPQLTLTARNVDGDVTRNYGGAFWKLDRRLGGRGYSDQSGSAAGLNTVLDGDDATLAGDQDFDGRGTLTLDDGPAGDAFEYARDDANPEAPFAARVDLVVPAADLTDSDGVCFEPAGGGGCSDFTLAGITGPELRFGRLMMDNAHGPQTDPLDLPVRAEYFDGTDFLPHADDGCTTLPPAASVTLSGWTEQLAAGETGVSGTSGLAAGGGTVSLTAPGTAANDANDGSVRVELGGVDTWLRTDEDGDGVHAEDPAARASFGMYRGDDRFLFWQEVQ